MAEHRRLDEFGDAAADTDTDAIDLEVTYRWDPDGDTCQVCGETATTFWHGEPGLVCPSCKAW